MYLVSALLCIANGCGYVQPSERDTAPSRISPAEVSLYIVDGISEQTHSCSAVLRNEGSVASGYVFEGVSCGCLVCERNGKELAKGEEIRIAPGKSEEIVLRTQLAYAEGYYSESALFRSADEPQRLTIVESQYGVLRRLRLSPGALVFESDQNNDGFEASANVLFRSTTNGSHRLEVASVPDSIHWRVEQKSQGVKQQLSSNSDFYYEDEWSVAFRIDPDTNLGPSLAPHGEVSFVVLDDQGKDVARRSMPYNAAGVEQ